MRQLLVKGALACVLGLWPNLSLAAASPSLYLLAKQAGDDVTTRLSPVEPAKDKAPKEAGGSKGKAKKGVGAPSAQVASAEGDPNDDVPSRVWRAKSWGSLLLTLAPGVILWDKAGLEGDFQPSEFLSFGFAAITSEQSFSYLGFSFGSFRETIYTVNTRLYPFTNSLNLLVGYGQRYYTLELGSLVSDRVLKGDWRKALDRTPKIEVANEIFELGFGNRWQLDKHISIGVDWLTLYMPTGSGRESAPLVDLVASEADARKFHDILRKLRRLTTFSLLKLQVGYSF